MPIRRGDLVLDVGSGSNPHPAADVLLEKFLDVTHRYQPFVADRPAVLADACKMPFRDKAFDFVIAFHVLEHMPDPGRFLAELQRVGKAGYIEVPNAIFERLVPYDVHLLEIMEVDGALRIHKKASARPDRYLDWVSPVTTQAKWRELFYGEPDLFHVRYLWKGEIRYQVMNPETSSAWFEQPTAQGGGAVEGEARKAGLRGRALGLARSWYRRRKRRKVDLKALVVCPDCHQSLEWTESRAKCGACRTTFPVHPLIDFNRGTSLED